MFRCVCPSLIFVLLSGVACVEVLSGPPDVFPSFPSSREETSTPTPPITQSSLYGTTDTRTTNEPLAPASTETTSEPHVDTSPATSEPTTEALTTPSTNATTASTTQLMNTTVLTTQHTNTTTAQTNATTVIPTMPSTLAPTTPPIPNPTVGDYFVRAEHNSSVCLMAKMGLQFSFIPSVGASVQTVNLDPSPNVTSSDGMCGSYGSDAILMLMSDKIKVQFTFSNQTNKFHLRVLNFTVDTGNGSAFVAVNSNLSLWEASLGSSYMCRKEQSYNITDTLTLNTFELQVQPFGVANDQFSTALECSVDDTSLLIPIIVGAALAGLILIVVIAYVIGRRKTYVGYQTL